MTRKDLFAMQADLITGLTDYSSNGKLGICFTTSCCSLGIEPRILNLLAGMALGKRIEKIRKLLPKTCAYLRPQIEELAVSFASKHPPLRAESFYNACQFYGFLRRKWKVEAPDPPFLPDLIYCELAVVAVERVEQTTGSQLFCLHRLVAKPFEIRRAPAVHLRHCGYDIEPVLAGRHSHAATIPARSVYLVLSRPLSATKPKVFEVNAGIFELLGILDGWVRQRCEEIDQAGVAFAFYRKFEELGFIEVRLCESH
jgi:hypothetical protein